MKVTSKKHSIFFRGLVLVVAFALSILCFPVNGLIALAEDVVNKVADENFLTIDNIGDGTSRVVSKGGTYTIPTAYIGGNNYWKIGKDNLTGFFDDSDTISYKSSNVKVTYNGAVIANSEDEGWTNSFVADYEGTYVVTYSYSYKIGDKVYTNSYDLEVQSVLSSASINFATNNKNIMPSILDLSVDGAKDANGNYKNLYIPLPEIKDKNDEVEKNVKFVSSLSDITEAGNYVVITANGGAKTAEVSVSKDDNGFFISGDYFKAQEGTGYATYGAGKYTVKFSYYVADEVGEGAEKQLKTHFVTSTTKSTQVYSADDKHYEKFNKLTLELSSDTFPSGQTGVETSLPSAKGVTSTDSDPASEEVEVYYTIEVLFTSNELEGGYKEFTAEQVAQYNADPENPVLVEEKDKDGNHVRYYLADPSKFKPLEDGSYTFIYTITDFYGHTASSSIGAYEFENIKDKQDPTPVIYDASNFEYKTDGEGNFVLDENGKKIEVQKYENASHKLASQSYPNSVIVYAIGIDDNVSKVGDEGVELTRKIMTSETVTKLTIEGYDAYNLVFNYRKTDSSEAYENLLSNNFLLKKATADRTIASDSDMLKFLKEKHYLIAIDNKNVEHIYGLFKDANIFDAEIASAENLKTWLKGATEEEIAKLGFAYFDVDTTFGATTADGGMGTGYYYIHYIAKDTAGNEADIKQRMNIISTDDAESPLIKFATTLQNAYLPDATITFDAPTATDTQDQYMVVRTMYRYLGADGVTPITNITNKDGETISNKNLTELWVDIDDEWKDDKRLTETYSKYHKDDNDGYIELTDKDASSYKIDLSEATGAYKLQIFVYVYDDAGNVGIYAQTIDISNANDRFVPERRPVEIDKRNFEQGETIKMPTYVFEDDAVEYMDFVVKVDYLTDDATIAISPIGSNEGWSEKDGTYTVNAGSFVASYAGDYRLTLAVSDAGGNTIVSFVNYTVSPRILIESPKISTSLSKTQTLELDDYVVNGVEKSLEIPAPTVTYDIPRSVTYAEYNANKTTYDNSTSDEYRDTDYVVYQEYSTNYGNKNSLSPVNLYKSGIDEIDLVYTSKVYVYNYKNFELRMTTYNESGVRVPGGLYYKDGSKITPNGDKIDFIKSDISYTLSIVKDETGIESYQLFNNDTNEKETLNTWYSTTGLSKNDFDAWFDQIKIVTLTSEPYNIKIQDKKGPTITEVDYPTAVSKEKLAEGEVITVYGIQAQDVSGIDMSKSTVTISWKLANGTSGSKEWKGEEAGKNHDKNDDDYKRVFPSTALDGTYTITYTVYDNAGNYSTKAYTIAVGDNVGPTMKFPDDFVKTSYDIGSELKIDLSTITITDNNEMPENSIPTVTLTNTSTGEVIEEKDGSSETVKYYDLDTVGTYTLTFTVEDKVGNTATETKTFEVGTKTQDATSVYKVVGTILIVVSVLVLAGVIIYFIVSKVKLDKELKK